MKTFERAITAFYSLLITVLAIFLMVISFNPYLLEFVTAYLYSNVGRITVAIIGFIFVILGFKTFIDSISKKKPSLALIQDTELGIVNITIPALEHLVTKAAKQIKEIKEIKSSVKPLTDGISIYLHASVSPESNLPFVTRELQDTVKGYIEQIAGIKVLEAKVLVNYISQENKLRVE